MSKAAERSKVLVPDGPEATKMQYEFLVREQQKVNAKDMRSKIRRDDGALDAIIARNEKQLRKLGVTNEQMEQPGRFF